MERHVGPRLLWPRAFVVGSLAVLFGVIGHVTADGLLPGPMVLGALLTFVVLISGPMLARPASSPRLTLMLVGGQTFVHLVLTLAAGHRGDPTAAAPAPTGTTLPTLPLVDGRRVGSLQDAYQGTSDPASSLAPSLPVGHLIEDLSAHAPMMVVHLVAAALVGLWLARGERYLWTILALTGRRVLAATWLLSRTPLVLSRLTAEPVEHAPAVPVSRRQARPHSRRGPPLLAV